ncbi:hypothetical protein SAMN05428949_1401 [Chitinophaga sp. YR627]|uniref:hypothetical protein n=1 Tax=Chitinophaga sp. YR627 TaxID=1881041 RepID=UPI0008E97897|nr:hypothetical protein [Chitinophaga sp. YR627]SFM94133.1 hypothetical protein SAMN05428949_1401 [Chitinophaga sp. YR627]
MKYKFTLSGLFTNLHYFLRNGRFLPNKLPVEQIEDYHTHYLGRAQDGSLFWGYTTFLYSRPLGELGKDWMQFRQEYAVMHFFTANGRYIESKSCCTMRNGVLTGIDEDEMLEQWAAELGNYELCDIEICLFQTKIDGYTFGLIPHPPSGYINLYPSNTIGFTAPWNGGYYT